MLKYLIETLDDVPEEHQALYAESQINGKKVHVLQVEGAVAKQKLAEFRDNNIKLKQQVEGLQDWEALEMTPEEVRELVAKRDAIEAAKVKGSGEDIEAQIAQRTEKMRKDFEARMAKITQERDSTNRQLSERIITQAALDAAGKKGLRPTATTDVTSRARSLFQLVDGKPTALEADGTPKYGKDGYSPLSVEEWVESLTAEAPHLFESSAGGGAGSASGAKGRVVTGRNPWKGGRGSKDWNLTEQGQILKADPNLAKRMMAQAGIRVQTV
jgi:hypothetical protein